MGIRIDAVRIEFDGGVARIEVDRYVEFEGSGTIRFDMPEEEPLFAVMQMLKWNNARLLALAKAAGQAIIDLG